MAPDSVGTAGNIAPGGCVSAMTESPSVCEQCGETFIQVTRLSLASRQGDNVTINVIEYPHRPCPANPTAPRLVQECSAVDRKVGMSLAELREFVDSCDMADGTVRVQVNLRSGIKKITVEES